MMEETRDEWARNELRKLLNRLEFQRETLVNLALINDEHAVRIKALETALRNQPANDGL